MKPSKQAQNKLKELEERMSVDNREGDLSRARSITVGTCFGGTTEIMMRGNNTYMWTPMQPVEVVELINQLAANIGCHVALKPKKDFASWRNWRVTDEEREHLNGHPPFVNDIAPYNRVGMEGLDPELEKALANDGKILEFGGGSGGHPNTTPRRAKNVMAIEEPKNRRSSKRASKAS